MAAPRLNLVVAVCNNGGIGVEGRIPWRIKQDLAFFKKITTTTHDAQKQVAYLIKCYLFTYEEQPRPRNGANWDLNLFCIPVPYNRTIINIGYYLQLYGLWQHFFPTVFMHASSVRIRRKKTRKK